MHVELRPFGQFTMCLTKTCTLFQILDSWGGEEGWGKEGGRGQGLE